MVNISKLRDPRTREKWYASGAMDALPGPGLAYVYFHALAVRAKRRGNEEDAKFFEYCATAPDEYARLAIFEEDLNRSEAERHARGACNKDCSLCADERYSYKAAGHYDNIRCPECGEAGRVGPGSAGSTFYCYGCCATFD